MNETSFSKGIVEFVELLPAGRALLYEYADADEATLDQVLAPYIRKRKKKGNLVFNYPRIQYATLDRGGVPESVNANWLTLSNDAYTNPSILTVTGETARVQAGAKIADPANPNNSILRFILDVGQFVGAWNTAVLIGGPTATDVVGTGKIIAAVNDVKDDTNAPLNRDGTTIHLVNWKLKHLDSSEYFGRVLSIPEPPGDGSGPEADFSDEDNVQIAPALGVV